MYVVQNRIFYKIIGSLKLSFFFIKLCVGDI